VNKHKFIFFLGVVLLAVLLLVPSAWAGETLSGEEVVIGADEVIEDDLYVAANEVIVEGTIGGDLVAVGNSVTVNGTVEGDLIAAGQSVEVAGQVDDDVRIAGQALLLSEGAFIEDDLIAAGYSLENEPESSVGGVLWYAGYQALLAGSVGRSRGSPKLLDAGRRDRRRRERRGRR
jgi:cytoskeletal protein CcmA (bactofilin family)